MNYTFKGIIPVYLARVQLTFSCVPCVASLYLSTCFIHFLRACLLLVKKTMYFAIIYFWMSVQLCTVVYFITSSAHTHFYVTSRKVKQDSILFKFHTKKKTIVFLSTFSLSVNLAFAIYDCKVLGLDFFRKFIFL